MNGRVEAKEGNSRATALGVKSLKFMHDHSVQFQIIVNPMESRNLQKEKKDKCGFVKSYDTKMKSENILIKRKLIRVINHTK